MQLTFVGCVHVAWDHGGLLRSFDRVLGWSAAPLSPIMCQVWESRGALKGKVGKVRWVTGKEA